MKILIVDDNTLVHYLIKAMIEKNNFELFDAYNGEEAIDIALNNELDLIFMDIMMPKLGGIEATKMIKKFSPDLPIISISAYPQNQETFGLFDDIIQKPFVTEQIINKIKKYQ